MIEIYSFFFPVKATEATPPAMFLASTLLEDALTERLVAIIVPTGDEIPKLVDVPFIVAAGIKLGR